MQNTQEIDTSSIESLVRTSMVSSKLAKLIASKNINVRYSSDAETASVDLESRTITFPYLGNMTNYDTHMLFLGHEVAHLLFSNQQMLEKMFSSNTAFRHFNIVIDIRDERKFKAEYPGFVKHFVKGYQNLLTEGFFGSKQSLCFRSFSARLNAFAKIGYPGNSFIPMSDDEHDFYNRCMVAETYEEIHRLASELQLLDSKSKKDMARTIRDASEDEIESLMSEFWSSDSDEEDEAPQELDEDQIEKLLEELQKDSAELTKESIKDNLINNLNVITYDSFTKDQCSNIIDAGKFIKDFKAQYSESLKYFSNQSREIKSMFKRSVDHMALEFESKKASFKDANRKLSKDGNLDLNRIALYRVSDEIFGLSRSLEIRRIMELC